MCASGITGAVARRLRIWGLLPTRAGNSAEFRSICFAGWRDGPCNGWFRSGRRAGSLASAPYAISPELLWPATSIREAKLDKSSRQARVSGKKTEQTPSGSSHIKPPFVSTFLYRKVDPRDYAAQKNASPPQK